MTSAVYKAKPNESPATVHVLETQPDMPPQGRQIADDVVGGLSAPPVVTQVRVDSPQGGVYEGWRIQSPADETFVLDKRGEPLVIVVYAPDAAAKPLAERLAADIGNGEGIMDQREMKDAIWALPATLPGGAVLEETASYTPEDIGMSANQLQSGLRDVGVSAGGAAASLDQILPNRITVGSYGDPSFQTWNVMVGSYGGTAKASVAWTVVKLMVKVMQSQPLAMPGGGDGLLITESGQQFLVFRKGPYLALLAGPTAASPQMLASWAAALQL
jgi:hypothetical protein